MILTFFSTTTTLMRTRPGTRVISEQTRPVKTSSPPTRLSFEPKNLDSTPAKNRRRHFPEAPTFADAPLNARCPCQAWQKRQWQPSFRKRQRQAMHVHHHPTRKVEKKTILTSRHRHQKFLPRRSCHYFPKFLQQFLSAMNSTRRVKMF